ncbi:MAG: flagellar basal body rod protein FlgC [Parvularculaceae bacterium]
MDDLNTALSISASGMRAQASRIRIVAENIANANSTPAAPGLEPYRRQVPVFASFIDKDQDATLVRLTRVELDPTAFTVRHDPSHPAADAEGNVLVANVNPLIEMMDLREAQRSYEANLGALDQVRSMAASTLRILE